MQWIRKGKKRRKEKKKRKGRKQGREEKTDREREEERERKKMGIFLAFRRSKLDDHRRKVDPRIAGYAWVPKSWSFFKLHEVGNFPT